ncbi:bifunctional 4-hydroxy-2-oxoglutarate aldolase/2-dehydro-3-deoxy-phosphogluconate aldolase [Actinomadura scrupuli]|uniref:bifunctional 4-hydroxy-2-oxoglutarate aldolase/2-dehydro-3-deoxy-phosphogluconate aldolase n=1 Tax=Actinomadura scrupuli TaxID=559629 RepID=UPI003D9546E0
MSGDRTGGRVRPEGSALAAIAETRILPVLTIEDISAAMPLAEALRLGGVRAIEVTLRSQAALPAIHTTADRGDLLVGAGTVLNPADVDDAVDAGAQFAVSPGFSPAVIEQCRTRGIAVIPGVATPTEILTAMEAGIDVLKFFPAQQLGGPPSVKALAAPFAFTRFIPTGGVGPANLTDYLSLPAVLAVGGAWMAGRELQSRKAWTEVTRLAAAAIAAAAATTQAAGTP